MAGFFVFLAIFMSMIRKLLREALLKEGAHKGNKYGCVMVYFDYDKKAWKAFQDLIDDEDLYNPKDDKGFGKEKDPHVTILYGLHSSIPDEDIAEEIEKIKTPKIKMNKISAFDNNPEFDVIKFDVESDDLHKLNKKFCKFPYTSDYPEYHPHATIAYVKKGKAKKYIDELNKAANIAFESIKIVYSKANGEKKNYEL